MSKPLKILLSQILPHLNNWKVSLLQDWENIVGNLKDHIKIEQIQNDNTLVIGVYNSAWMQELFLLSNMLLEKINATLEYPHVKQLRFKYSPRGKKLIQTTVQKNDIYVKKVALTAKEQEALRHIIDPDLQKALESFLKRCHQGKDHEKKDTHSGATRQLFKAARS